MTDFSKYPNLDAYIKSKGGIKEKLLNKAVFAANQGTWDKLSEEELARIEADIPKGQQIFDAMVTPTAIIFCAVWTAKVVPVRDILWVFTRINKQKMNFITISRIHNLLMLDRNGEWYSLGFKSTGTFSKATPADDALEQVKQIIEPAKPGIIFGYDEDASNWCESHVDLLIEKVEGKKA